MSNTMIRAGLSAIVVIAVAAFILFRPHASSWNDVSATIPAATKGVSFTDGPFEIWDAHTDVDPNGMTNVIGTITNKSSNTVTVGEVSVLDGNKVMFDTQPTTTLQPGQTYVFIAVAQDKSYTEFNSKTLIVGYK